MFSRAFALAGRGVSAVKAVAKLSALATVVAVGMTGYVAYDGARDRVNEVIVPKVDKARDYTESAWDKTENYAERGWSKVEENPAPWLVAILPFLLAVIYHKAKGKSFAKALEVATTRVHTVSMPTVTVEPGAVAKARARATYQQLERDQAELENRLKSLPGRIEAAEKVLARTRAELAAARKTLTDKESAEAQAERVHATLVRENANGLEELVEIDASLAALTTKI